MSTLNLYIRVKVFAFKHHDNYHNYRKDMLKNHFYLSNILRSFLHMHCGKWMCKRNILRLNRTNPHTKKGNKMVEHGIQVVRSCLSRKLPNVSLSGSLGCMAGCFFWAGNKEPQQNDPLPSDDLSQSVLRETGISNRWRLSQLLAARE